MAGLAGLLSETAQILLSTDLHRAVGMTLWISGLSAVAAIGVGLVMAFCRLSPQALLTRAAMGLIEVFRNTPLLIQLLFWYSGLQSIGLTLPPEVCGMVGLSLYTGAFLAEIFRAGVQAVCARQRDAALALGLTPLQAYLLTLLPQAVRMILPSLANQLASLVKNSSLLAFITVEETFYLAYRGAVEGFRPAPFFLAAALVYAGITLGVSAAIHGLERVLGHRPSKKSLGVA